MTILNSLIGAVLLMAQTSAPTTPPAPVLQGGNMLMLVQNLEKSVEFYRDFVGLPQNASATIRPYAPVTAGLADMYIARGAQMRNLTLMIPGSDLRLEMIDFKDVDAIPQHPHLQDPGATLIMIKVRDVDPVASRAAQNGVQMLTPGGKPAVLDGGKARAIFVKDPTGVFVEIVQRNEPIPPNAPAGNVIGASLGITIKDTEETVRFYREIFGFEVQTGTWIFDKPFTDAAGLPTAQYRKSTATITSTNLQMEFYEYRGIDRTPMKAVIHDPGVAIMRLMVKDINATIKGVRAAGMPIVNWSGEPTIQIALWFFMGRDPNNFFFQMQQPAQIGQRQ
jgi:catechol 2,3-dioxygenase-like lactoylglutathione lyase family enzyme